MANRKPEPPPTPTAADALTRRELDVFILRHVFKRKVYAATYEALEERKSPPQWGEHTDPEAEPYYIPCGKPWPTHRYSSKTVPALSRHIYAVWDLVRIVSEKTGAYRLNWDAETGTAEANLTLVAKTAACARLSETASGTPEEAQCIAICRAAWRAVCYLRERGDE